MTVYFDNDCDAATAYGENKDRDPFPEIPPSLLNSADIIDYVLKTGMISPFRVTQRTDTADDHTLKPASYVVEMLGEVLYWDDEGNRHSFGLARGDEFTVAPNSIVFVQLEPMFRVPNYIALRFNFKIKHVYRGLLLGTGPLVDPGFVGKINIPLHNMTNQPYKFKGGEELVWFEFTKVTPLKQWNSNCYEPGERRGQFYEFPRRKNERNSLADYVHYACPNSSVRSSIPPEIKKATQKAEEAHKKADEARNRIMQLGIAGAVALLISVTTVAIGLFNPTINTINSAHNYVTSVKEMQNSAIEEMREEIETLRAELANLEDEIRSLKKDKKK